MDGRAWELVALLWVGVETAGVGKNVFLKEGNRERGSAKFCTSIISFTSHKYKDGKCYFLYISNEITETQVFI